MIPNSRAKRLFLSSILILTIAVLVGVISIQRNGTLLLAQEKPENAEIIELHLPTDGSFKASENVEVEFDVVYQKSKRYQGVKFANYLKSRGALPNIVDSHSMVEFICTDGYNPFEKLTNLVTQNAFIAMKDLDAPQGQTWISFPYGNSMRTPGTFYLVWPNASSIASKYPWPYGIVALRMGKPEILLRLALPKSANVDKGFRLFREHCMMCHSINGVGGSVGIDLNVPLNIFEYWQPAKLPLFITSPQNFRKNVNMPAFDYLEKQEIVELLEYIRHMRQHKILPK